MWGMLKQPMGFFFRQLQLEFNCFYLWFTYWSSPMWASQESGPQVHSRMPALSLTKRDWGEEWQGVQSWEGVKKRCKGIVNLRETSLPGPRPLEFGYGDTLASCPGCSLFHLEWEWVGQTEGGCRRQDSGHAGNRLESILSKALRSGTNSRGSQGWAWGSPESWKEHNPKERSWEGLRDEGWVLGHQWHVLKIASFSLHRCAPPLAPRPPAPWAGAGSTEGRGQGGRPTNWREGGRASSPPRLQGAG